MRVFLFILFSCFVLVVNAQTLHNGDPNQTLQAPNHNSSKYQETFKKCMFKQTSNKLEKLVKRLIEENGEKISNIINSTSEDNQSIEKAIHPTNRKIRETIDWNKCVLKSELEEHKFIENEHILTIKRELEKLQELVRLLRDQQYILNILSDFDGKPKPKIEEEADQRELLELLHLLKNNLPNSKGGLEGKSIDQPPKIENKENLEKIKQEIITLKQIIQNKSGQETNSKKNEEKLQSELEHQKNKLVELQNEVEVLRNRHAKPILLTHPSKQIPENAQNKPSARDAGDDAFDIQDELENIQDTLDTLLPGKPLDILGAPPLPLLPHSPLMQKLQPNIPFIPKPGPQVDKSRKSSDSNKSKTRKSEIEELQKQLALLKTTQNKNNFNRPNTQTRAGEEELFENLQKLLEGSDPSAENKEVPLDFNFNPNMELENRLSDLETQLKLSSKVQKLEKKIKELQDDQESKSLEDEEDLKHQIKKLQRQINKLDKSKSESKALDDQGDLLEELKSLQSEINDLRPKDESDFSSKDGGVDFQIMLNKLFGSGGGGSASFQHSPKPSSHSHGSHLSPTQVQYLKTKLMAMKYGGGGQHYGSYGGYGDGHSPYGYGGGYSHDSGSYGGGSSGAYGYGPSYGYGSSYYGGGSNLNHGGNYYPSSKGQHYGHGYGSSAYYGGASTPSSHYGGGSSYGGYKPSNYYNYGSKTYGGGGGYGTNTAHYGSYGSGDNKYGSYSGTKAGGYGGSGGAEGSYNSYNANGYQHGGYGETAYTYPGNKYGSGSKPYGGSSGEHAPYEASGSYGDSGQYPSSGAYGGGIKAPAQYNSYKTEEVPSAAYSPSKNQFFPSYDQPGYAKANSASYQSGETVNQASPPQPYSNTQENPVADDAYAQQKVGELKTQIYGLQHVIDHLNAPEYVQSPQDQDTIYKLDQKIGDLKNVVNHLTRDMYSPEEQNYPSNKPEGEASYRFANSQDNQPTKNRPNTKTRKTRNEKQPNFFESLLQSFAPSANERSKRDAPESEANDNKDAFDDVIKQMSNIYSVIKYYGQKLSNVNSTQSQNRAKREIRSNSGKEQIFDKNPNIVNDFLDQLQDLSDTIHNALEMVADGRRAETPKNSTNTTSSTFDKVITLFHQINDLVELVDYVAQSIFEGNSTCSDPNGNCTSTEEKRRKRQILRLDEEGDDETSIKDMSQFFENMINEEDEEDKGDEEPKEERPKEERPPPRPHFFPNMKFGRRESDYDNTRQQLQQKLEDLKNQLGML